MGTVRYWRSGRVVDRARQLLTALHCRRRRQWLCPDAVQFLEEWLEPVDIGFQWGSGDSTLWLAKRVRHLTSVEYDPARAPKVRAQLLAEGLDERVTYHLESHGNAKESLDAPYVRLIDSFADRSLDFSLVSGPLAFACCLASILKLKSSGLLILEKADRYLSHNGELTTSEARWIDVVWHLAPWRQVWTTNGLSETAIFIKP